MASITLNSSVASLDARRRLAESTSGLMRTFERLSSGLRINRPSDDASGLSISELLKADNRVLLQGIRNVNDGIGVLNIADGALDNLGGILGRLRELAAQCSNGTLGYKQRGSLDEEAQALSMEYNRIARTTSFNAVNIFDGSKGDTTLQAGYSKLAFHFGGAIGDGTLRPSQVCTTGANPLSVAVGDFNGDGDLDFVDCDSGTEVNVFLGKGDGTFFAARSFAAAAPNAVRVADFNGDGLPDLVTSDLANSSLGVLLGVGDGTFRPQHSYAVGDPSYAVTIGDLDGDGVLDLVSTNTSGATATVLLGNGDGSFRVMHTFAVGVNPYSGTLGDFNGDGVPDLAIAESGNRSVTLLLGNGDGGFKAFREIAVGIGPVAVACGDFDGDGKADLVSANYNVDTVSILLGNGDGTFRVYQDYATGTNPIDASVSDFNGDGILDVLTADVGGGTLSILIGNGDGTFRVNSTISAGVGPFAVAIGDFNADGVSDVVAADHSQGSTAGVFLGNSVHGVSALQAFALSTVAGSRNALTYFSQVQSRISTQRGEIGTFQSLARFAVTVLSTTAEQLNTAAGRITDADIAEEAAYSVKLRVLQQTCAAVLAQANQDADLSLALLGSI